MAKKIHARVHGIGLKKYHGQHFLRDPMVIEHMLSAVELNATTSVLEIGPGDGFLTRAILQKNIARLWAFEIDVEWVSYLQKTFKDPRITIFHQNILDIDIAPLQQYAPWILLSNLPYHVTWPILRLIQKHRDLFKEGVFMVQEEVAQKLVATSGRGYGYPSLFFQHYFDFKLLAKVPPEAFQPPPKVYSRLVYFKPRIAIELIEQEEKFWRFIKLCFHQPRRTLRNNLQQSSYDIAAVPAELLALRAQQLSKEQLLQIWWLVKVH